MEPKLLPVTRHTRAGKTGKIIICPECDGTRLVYNFSWSQLNCRHCNRDIEKFNWLVQPKLKSKPSSCLLCGRETIYKTKIEHPYYRDPGVCYNCGFVQQVWSLILALTDPVEFQCPWGVHLEQRCQHKTVFTREQLLDSYAYPFYGGTAYHNPSMNISCPSCGHYTSGTNFILNNMDVIKLAQSTATIETENS